MKISIEILIVVLLLCSCEQTTDPSKNGNVSTHIDSVGLWSDYSSTTGEIELRPYIDSLNLVLKYKKLPTFLFIPNFDYEANKLWPGPHSPVPLRKMIVSRIVHCKVIDYILENCEKSKISISPKMTYPNPDSIRHFEKSMLILLEERKHELECFE